MLHYARQLLGSVVGGPTGPTHLITQNSGFSGSGTTSTYVTITQSGDLDFVLPPGYTKITVAVDISSMPPNAIGGDDTRSWSSNMKVQINVGSGFVDQGSVDISGSSSIRFFDEIEGENVYEKDPASHIFTVPIEGLVAGTPYSVRVLQDVDAAPNAVVVITAVV
jgi:hypothetical protein